MFSLSTIFFFICLVFPVVWFIILRLCFRFWSQQPVMHLYDIHRFCYLFFCGNAVIRKELPNKANPPYSTFVKLYSIDTFSSLLDLKHKQIHDLIYTQYLNENENKNHYKPQPIHIWPYFVGHNYPFFWSIYKTKENDIIGCISSRPLLFFSSNKRKETKQTTPRLVYYVDFMCVDKQHRKQGIGQQLIQTHEYQQAHQQDKTTDAEMEMISLFKREEELTAIIPLTTFATVCFSFASNLFALNSLAYFSTNIVNNCPQLRLIDGNVSNLVYLFDFLQQQMDKIAMDCLFCSDVANVAELVKTKNMFIYMIVNETKNICAAYFFKTTKTTLVEGNDEVLCCVGSIFDKQLLGENEFVGFFHQALKHIQVKAKQQDNKEAQDTSVQAERVGRSGGLTRIPDEYEFLYKDERSGWAQQQDNEFKHVSMELVAHNILLHKSLTSLFHFQPLFQSPTAYFLYNFIHPVVSPAKCLFIGT